VIRIRVTLVVLALVLAGCGGGLTPGGRPILEVGSQKVTVADFDRAARNAAGQYLSPPEQAKRELVLDLQRRAVLLELAHRLGHDSTAVMADAIRDDERRLILQRLYAQLAPQAQRVSEAEAHALYESRNEEGHVHLLYTSSEQAARAALEQIRRGEPFARVATRNSLLGVLPPDGDMGWIAPGALPDPLDDALRTLGPGELGGPYARREGWFVMQVSERRPCQQPSYDTIRSDMIAIASRRKFGAAYERAYEGLKQAYELRHAPGGAQLFFRTASPVDPRRPTDEMRARPLVTWRGGVYTLGDALDDLSRPEAQAPSMNLLPAVEIWLEAQAMGRISVLEARRRHLHEEPDVVAGLRARREQGLLEGAYNIATAGVPPPGPEQVALAWERVKSQFTRLVSVKVALVESPDSAVVRRVADTVAGSGTLAEAAAKVGGAPAATTVEVAYPNPDPEWAVFEAMFTQQQPGGRFGPSQTARGWRILQLLEKQVAQQQWEDLPEPLRQNIAASAGELARDERFRRFTDSLAVAYRLRVDSSAVAKLRWPGPAGLPGMPPGM
jgi:parvulin-like peptidyl-prolyl isomerase